MIPRERLLSCLEHKEPDRVPLDLGGMMTTIEAGAYDQLKSLLGIESETIKFMREHVVPDENILEKLGVDTRYVRMNPSPNRKASNKREDSYVDEWGIVWRKPKGSLYYDPVGSPLHKVQTISELNEYNFPNPRDHRRVDGLREKARALYRQSKYAIIADAPQQGIFETAFLLRGLSNFLEDLALREDFAKELLSRICDYMIGLYDTFLTEVGEYVQVVFTGDDVGMQDRLLISPTMYRQIIKPFHRKFWHFIKQKTQAYLFFHSCGSVYPLIPDFIEMGVDILNPIQVSAKDMNSARLKEEFGDKISFWGAIDTQRVLPYGSPDEVEAEVKQRIKDLAPGGGYVLCAVHDIQPDVKPENVVSMYESARKYGTYPIRL